MNTLQNISCELVRKDWINYKDIISTEQSYYRLIWNDWIRKHNIDENCPFVKIVHCFIEKSPIDSYTKIKYKNYIFELESDNHLIIKHMSSPERKQLHNICDLLGLHHQTLFYQYVNKNNKTVNKKGFNVYIPENWCWEFSEANPYGGVYLQNIKQKKDKIKREKEREKQAMFNSKCEKCKQKGSVAPLYISLHYDIIICEKCSNITKGKDGYFVSDFKMESLYYDEDEDEDILSIS